MQTITTIEGQRRERSRKAGVVKEGFMERVRLDSEGEFDFSIGRISELEDISEAT